MQPRASQEQPRRCGLAIAALAALAACESPARVKPWKHAPDPLAVAGGATSSTALAQPSSAAADDELTDRLHTLRIAVDAEPGRLSPLNAPSTWSRRILLGAVFEPLLRYLPPDQPGDPGRYAPRLARTWKVMPSGLEVRIELQPGATFHDGHPLSTSDVQFTYDWVRDPKHHVDHLRPLLDNVDAIELITATQVRLRLHKPGGWPVRALAEIPILPMHVYKDEPNSKRLVGSGPFKVASTADDTVHLTRYARYWGDTLDDAPPALRRIQDIELVYDPDASAVLMAAKRGEMDIIPALVPAHWPEQANAPGIASRFDALQLQPPRLRYLLFNTVTPPLDDVRVRHALALMFDRAAVARGVYDGLWRPVLWPIWPGGPVDGVERPVPDFDPAAAGKLLDEVGYSDRDGDGVRERDGVPLTLTLLSTEKATTPDPAAPQTMLDERDRFVDACRRAGIAIMIKTGGEQVLENRLRSGEFQLAIVEWGGMVDGDVSSILRTGGAENYGKASSPDVDRALDALANAWDPAERRAVSAQLATALEASWPIAGIIAPAPQGLVHQRVTGVAAWDGWFDLSALTWAPPARNN